MKKTLFLLFAILAFSSIRIYGGNVTLSEIDNYNNWGWKALLIDNGTIQLLILPEIGGRVLHYGFADDIYLAVNSSEIDNVYNPTTNQTGPWSSWGYGGYKVWPAPQSVWNWPPPPYLDWGNYTYSIEHNSVDSVIIYMQSEVESYKTAGLQQARRYKVYKNSTRVVIEQILTNVSSTNTEWSIWEVTQAVIEHGNDNDYQNISTYFPSDEASIKVINNMGPELITTEVAENVRKFNFNGGNQKIGTLLKEGWSCFVDESEEQAYAKVFDIYPTTEQYPDQNTNFQIYAGGNYIEIEVLGPLTEIAQGDSSVYIENWYAAHVKGDVLTTNHAGLVRNKLTYSKTTPNLTGEYGIFQSGKLKIVFSNSTSVLQEIDTINVEAAQEYNLNINGNIPTTAKKVELFAYNENNELIGLLDSWSGNLPDAIYDAQSLAALTVYPTISRAGNEITIQLNNNYSGELQIELTDLNGRTIYSADNTIQSAGQIIYYSIPDVAPGIYCIRISSELTTTNSKIIIQ